MSKLHSNILALATLLSPLAAVQVQAQEMTSEQIEKQLDKLLPQSGEKTRGLNANNSIDYNRPLYPTPPPPPPQPHPQPPQVIELSFREITFALNSADIRPSSERTLAQIVAALSNPKYRGYRFEIIGHTDAQGAADYNQRLSVRRAVSVQTYLITQGVGPANLRASGRGESELADPSRPNAQINRRVVVRAQASQQ